MQADRPCRAGLSFGLVVLTLLLGSCSTAGAGVEPTASSVTAPISSTASAASTAVGSSASSSASSSAESSDSLSSTDAQSSTAVASPTASASSASGAFSSASADPPVNPQLFTNPVVPQDFPDPGLLEVDGTFYLYGTERRGTNLQLQTSTDLVTWTDRPDPLPVLGSWADRRKTWAPEVTRVGDEFVLFYTAADRASGKQCIGRAVSGHPAGPFADDANAPFLCQVELGGSIDANPIVAPNGDRYLYWKSDGNCCGRPVGLWGQAMNPAADQLVGDPVELLTTGKDWQGPLIEGPEMVVHDGGYYLFYAGNSYSSPAYAEGVARCAGPLGPCADSAVPLLTSNDVAVGPGHGFVFAVGDEWWILYHAYPPDAVGQDVPGRLVWLDRVTWTPGGPVINGPTGIPQPAPVF